MTVSEMEIKINNSFSCPRNKRDEAGQGVTQDYKEAVKWYRLAAEQGHAKSQFNLGTMYDNGQGVTQDYQKAVKWFRLSAEHGYAKARFDLGLMYENGQGVLQDYKKAVKWYRLAADQGCTSAQLNLGAMHHEGKGVSQDYVQAHMWFHLAGVKGDKDAVRNRNIAEKCMTPKDILEAQRLVREWMEKALQKYWKNVSPGIEKIKMTAKTGRRENVQKPT